MTISRTTYTWAAALGALASTAHTAPVACVRVKHARAKGADERRAKRKAAKIAKRRNRK